MERVMKQNMILAVSNNTMCTCVKIMEFFLQILEIADVQNKPKVNYLIISDSSKFSHFFPDLSYFILQPT